MSYADDEGNARPQLGSDRIAASGEKSLTVPTIRLYRCACEVAHRQTNNLTLTTYEEKLNMAMIRRGTTPTLTFEFEENLEDYDIDELYVTFAQRDIVFLELDKNSVVIEGNILQLKLTQEETLKIMPYVLVAIQIRMRDTDDNAYATELMYVDAEQVLKGGVI